MKRSLFNPHLKRTILAVPACALMLGAAQAGTTIGLNFQSWYYDSGSTPQTVGFGQGYQTTGFPVTAHAFGVNPANWVNTLPQPCGSATVGYSIGLGSARAVLNTVNFWESDVGNLVAPANEWSQGGPLPVSLSSVAPGNDEVTWSFEDNTGWTNSLSDLSGAFPNGYVIELISPNAVGGTAKCNSNSVVLFTDNTTFTNAVHFGTFYTAGNSNYSATVGLMAVAFTNNGITFGAVSRNVSNTCCSLAGFILTDQPVVSLDPSNTIANQGGTLSLNATVIGLGTLAYQWQHAGTNFPGATTLPFSKTATLADAGSWVLVVTNLYGSATSDAATVTVTTVPSITTDLATATDLIYKGTPLTLSVVAGGSQPLNYQWYQNGVALAGATNSAVVLSNLTAGLFGYNVVVSNQYSPPVALSSTNYLNVMAEPDAYTTAVAADSPNSYWPLGETTGATSYDYSGSGHNGEISNNVVLGVPGPRPPAFPGFSAGTEAYQFDGASGFIACGTAASLDGPTDFTVEAWINTSSATTQVIAQQRDVAGYNGEYQFTVDSGGNLEFYIYNGGYQADLITLSSVADGAWHHVVAVRSGANMYIYVDGAQAASGSGTEASLVGTLQTYIGSDQRGTTSYFNGSMAAVAIYSHALSSSRIIQHYAVGSGASFTMSFKPGGMIMDSKPAGTPHPGRSHNVGWTNSITDSASTPVTRTGVAVFSETASSQIATPDNSDFDTTNGTVCFWLMAEAPLPGPGSEGAMLVDRRTTNGAVIVLHADGSIFWQGASGRANAFSGGYVPDANWHHVALSYGQTTNDTLSLYVDGALAASTPVTNAWSWPAGEDVEIGLSHDSYWQRFDGQMDDFRIYKRILTAAEVGQVYASDALVDTNALAVRYNFDSAIYGQSVVWPFGQLQTSPTLGPSAVWTTVTNALSPYGFLPTAPSLFYRSTTTP
jgi:hypothetical protein